MAMTAVESMVAVDSGDIVAKIFIDNWRSTNDKKNSLHRSSSWMEKNSPNFTNSRNCQRPVGQFGSSAVCYQVGRCRNRELMLHVCTIESTSTDGKK